MHMSKAMREYERKRIEKYVKLNETEGNIEIKNIKYIVDKDTNLLLTEDKEEAFLHEDFCEDEEDIITHLIDHDFLYKGENSRGVQFFISPYYWKNENDVLNTMFNL